MAEKTVRIALIGFGSMGKNYARMLYAGLVPELKLSGVCCRNGAGQALLREEFPGVRIYENVEQMQRHEEEFDAVLIVTPHATHVELGFAMAKLGKHFLMDKPAGVYASRVQELVEFCRERGVSFGMMFNNRMLPAFRIAQDYIRSGKLGRLHRAVWVCNSWYRSPVYHRSAPWRSSWQGEGGGLLINQNQHYLDIWQWLFGMPEKLYAAMEFGRYNDFAVDDAVDIQFVHSGGFHGTMVSATGEAPGVNRLEIWGEKGCLTVQDGARVFWDENALSTVEFGKVNEVPFGTPPHTRVEIPVEKAENPYLLAFGNFAGHLLRGEPLFADGMDGLRTVQLTNAAYLSGWQEKRVSVPVDAEAFQKELAARQALEQIL